MNDLISRQQAIDAINVLHDKLNAWLDCAVDAVMALPSAQPERKKGKWILRTFNIRCSNCDKVFSDNLYPANYCPNCGARME